ncbi:2-C-methyl-D-erythritol 2,4-cyclodiphosphate synthase [Eubacteriales bacterium OttesenSCG-928-N14]|nr:2-C-methyl-D-erythritol 2,4-cyclodiphosphate synthase [Eubacteriales bacterium OttesenSCG-928-N14]
MIRVGIGYDAHRLVEGRKLILGGVHIPFEKGLAGHSDADVLSHAVADALLGACALGDIGTHFPDGDARYKDADSIMLLKIVTDMVHEQGYDVYNIDATVVAEQPKLAPYYEPMAKNLAKAVGIEPHMANVKASTTEGMGFEGTGEGMSCYAAALLIRKNLGEA